MEILGPFQYSSKGVWLLFIIDIDFLEYIRMLWINLYVTLFCKLLNNLKTVEAVSEEEFRL